MIDDAGRFYRQDVDSTFCDVQKFYHHRAFKIKIAND